MRKIQWLFAILAAATLGMFMATGWAKEQNGELAGLQGEIITAKYLKGALPVSATAQPWAQAKPSNVRLSPQVSTFPMITSPKGVKEIVRSVKVQALYNDKELALRLEWVDPEPTRTEDHSQSFKDAVAVEFPLKYGQGVKLPYMGMGQKGAPVYIWQWKASWQADGDQGYQDVEKTYPNMAVDDYPLSKAPMGAHGGPARSPAVDQDRTFMTGWAAGSPLSDPTKKGPVESLVAEGFGSLTSLGSGEVQGKGMWNAGKWQVVLKRSLQGDEGRGGVQFDPGRGLVPVAFAVWDGHFDQRNGQKGLSSWHFLVFEQATPPKAYVEELSWNPPIQGDPKEGRRWAIEMLECDQCHNFPGARPEKMGDVGPDLTYIGGMHRPDYLLESLKDPNAVVVPNSRYMDPTSHKSTMPLYEPDTVPEKAYYDMVEFMRTLK